MLLTKKRKKKGAVFGSKKPTKIIETKKTRKKCKDKEKKEKHFFSAGYENNYNINKLFLYVKSIIKENEEKSHQLEEELKKLMFIKTYTSIPDDIITCNNKISFIKSEIDDIKKRCDLEKYEIDTSILLKEYNTYNNSRKFGKFDNKEIPRRLEIISEFIQISKKYASFNVYRTKKLDYKCINCGEKIVDTMKKCDNCRCSISGVNTKNIDRNCIIVDKISDRKKNFRNALKSFLGYDRNIPEVVHEKLNKYIESHKLDKKTITKNKIKKILKVSKLSSHYDKVNAIYNDYNNLLSFTITNQVRENIMERHELIDSVYERIKPDYRTNSLNIKYLLFFTLCKEGVKIPKEELEIFKTRDVELFHEEMMTKICKVLSNRRPDMDWKFINIL